MLLVRIDRIQGTAVGFGGSRLYLCKDKHIAMPANEVNFPSPVRAVILHQHTPPLQAKITGRHLFSAPTDLAGVDL